ncbi:MAG: hypothetical protein ACXWKP_31280 [Bradyrhizobium sp.]
MSNIMLRRAALAALALLLPISGASAHCFVGARFLPATLNVDDPCVADELSLPTVSRFRNGDDPSARQTDISSEVSKRITDTFGVSVGATWTHLRPPGGPSVSGFQNIETSFKWQALTVPEHEFVMSVALNVEWGGTGAQSVGAEAFNTYTPTVYFGKGLGDLPQAAGWLRAFAVTGQVGYAIPGRRSTISGIDIDPDTGAVNVDVEYHAQVLTWGGSLQYSMPYLKSNIVDLALPDFFNRLIPILEVSLQTPVANTLTSGTATTGTINPGVIWAGNTFQVAAEAIIPVNRASGTGIGGMMQLHFYLDDIFPQSIGRPIFASSPMPGSIGR